MLKLNKLISNMVITLIMASFLFLPGCKGSDTREKVDDTVEELAGKKKVDQMKKMEKQIGDIADQQAKKIKDLEEESE